MAKFSYETIRPVLSFLSASGVGGLLAPLFRGEGVIFTIHHVRPQEANAFAPNQLLEITPDFLDAVIGLVRALGYDLVSLDEALTRLERGGGRFAAFTLDDGYRDNLVNALPIFRRHGCPFALFVATEFLDGVGELWWQGLEESLRRLDEIRLPEAEGGALLSTRTAAEKQAAYTKLYRHVRSLDDPGLRAVVRDLCEQAGFALSDLCSRLCLSWDELAGFIADPLLTLGAHSVSHPFLAKLPIDQARDEIAQCKAVLEARFGRTIDAIAYPIGDLSAAGPREFELAAQLGFRIGVTTRPGLLYRCHAEHRLALPRVSLNGEFQRLGFVRELLNGLPFALANRFRRLNVA